jgi:hypothetical protein
MLYNVIAFCSQIHTKHINTLCGRNVELLNDRPGGTYSNHRGCKTLNSIHGIHLTNHLQLARCIADGGLVCTVLNTATVIIRTSCN